MCNSKTNLKVVSFPLDKNEKDFIYIENYKITPESILSKDFYKTCLNFILNERNNFSQRILIVDKFNEVFRVEKKTNEPEEKLLRFILNLACSENEYEDNLK